MTRDEAVKLYDSKFWESLLHEELARYQIMEERLIMPFAIFHEAVEKTIGRSVFTHEFGVNYEGLKKEILGDGPAPTFEEIMNMIPEEKRIVCVVD